MNKAQYYWNDKVLKLQKYLNLCLKINSGHQFIREMKVKKYDPTKNRLENELTVSALKLKLDNVQGTILLKWNSFKIA